MLWHTAIKDDIELCDIEAIWIVCKRKTMMLGKIEQKLVVILINVDVGLK